VARASNSLERFLPLPLDEYVRVVGKLAAAMATKAEIADIFFVELEALESHFRAFPELERAYRRCRALQRIKSKSLLRDLGQPVFVEGLTPSGWASVAKNRLVASGAEPYARYEVEGGGVRIRTWAELALSAQETMRKREALERGERYVPRNAPTPTRLSTFEDEEEVEP